MSSPELAIAITAHNRPEYLNAVISSWHGTGWEKYPTVFQCEPVNEHVIQICRDVPHAMTVVNPELRNALGNPWYAIESGFKLGAEFVVLGEDDSIVSPDVLAYFLKAKRFYQQYHKMFAVCSFVREPLGEPYQFYPQPNFASVVWGIWRDRWEGELRDDWGWDYSSAWDGRIIDHLRGRMCVYPGHSRSQHIGRLGGTHMTTEMYDLLKSNCFYSEGKEWRWGLK